MGVSVLRGTASRERDEAQGHGIRACSQGVSEQWFDDLIGDESGLATSGVARRINPIATPPSDEYAMPSEPVSSWQASRWQRALW